MHWFDTHAHLDGFAAEGRVPEILARAAAAGVTHICAVGGTPAGNDCAVQLARQHPGHLHAAVGLDRDQAERPRDAEASAALAELAADSAVVAIGETGLDYYYSADTAPAQRALFEDMLALALRARKPVIVHSRYADADTIAMLTDFSTAWKKLFHSVEKSEKTFPYRGKNEPNFPHCGKPAENASAPPPPGVLHCFTGDADFAAELAALGFFISFSGIVTFNNADPLRAVARDVPAEQVLVETDCPYLTPKPFRGRVNEPAYVAHVGERMAEVRGVPAADMAALTTANARRLFQLEK